MMMNLKKITLKPSKMGIKVKFSSLATIIVHFSDDNGFAQLYIIMLFMAKKALQTKQKAPGVQQYFYH